ncbi:MAG: helix-turn-helix transcriptional regulator [Clostridia bacterium]|nr:helix-turn-helix transcriptional regulator [Clostridia bacterium]
MEMNIGKNIKRLRIAKNITQEQLSCAMNVTCAAVSKWERGETYPEITLLQPLAYFFGVTLDELMGYNQEKIQAEIDKVVDLYRKHWNNNKGHEIIVKAYKDYPNDYWIMHYYMWHIAGDLADNDPVVLIQHKDEFLSICDKILDGCSEESLRRSAWNMQAKILHAEGKTNEALEIYQSNFPDWFTTSGQKIEQLFGKGTKEYYFYVQKNMFELAEFAADKFGRTVFFDPATSMEEKVKRALQYGSLMISVYEETDEEFFLTLAKSFLKRMENDFRHRGGTEEQVASIMDMKLRLG